MMQYEKQAKALLQKAQDGFNTLPDINQSYKDAALKNLEKWLNDSACQAYTAQIEDIIKQQRWDFLLDSFFQIIPFGTGGRRGPVGIGTNRINPHTIASSIQGHVEYLKQKFSGNLSVVIAYDVRIFKDIKKLYNPQLENPLLNKGSIDFAKIAAGVYAANDVIVHMIPEKSPIFLSTPELSFCIRHLKANGGLNISASHNPPDDNGAKFYNHLGGQEIPPDDQTMSDLVDRVEEIKQVDFDSGVKHGFIKFIGPEVHDAYLTVNLKIPTRSSKHSSAKITYSPLNGTGSATVGDLLERSGFDLIKVSKQYDFDGSFQQVKFRIPNPEVVESMEMCIATAQESNALVAMVSDPDADRIGVAAPDKNGKWTFLNGNEIGIILTHYLLELYRENNALAKTSFAIRTEVTTELISRIAESFGVQMVDDLLVGFKYIGNVLHKIESTGYYNGIEGKLDNFIIAAEESHGILVTPHIRDKDAAGAALLIADLATYLKEEGQTVIEYLDVIYKKYGYVKNSLVSTIMEGVTGKSRIMEIQKTLRDPQKRPNKVGELKILKFIDRLDEKLFGPILSETDKNSRDLLTFKLENNIRITLRPSGTEPKNKIYFEIRTAPLGEDASDDALSELKKKTDQAMDQITRDFTLMMLNTIGIEISPHALKISGLVSLENKIDFVEKFIPELAGMINKGKDQESISGWIDERLNNYGKDPRYLVDQALEACLKDEDYLVKLLAKVDSPHPNSEWPSLIRNAFWGNI